MNLELMLIAVICGLTLLAYMIAINAHGAARLSLSYLIATVMMAGTVYIVVQYYNEGVVEVKTEELRKLEMEKQFAEEQLQSQQAILRENRSLLDYATRFNTVVNTGTGYASSLVSVDLQDRNSELETLMARSSSMKKKSDALKLSFDNVKTSEPELEQSGRMIKEALQALNEAAYYYRSYYYSEDSEQEQLRERLLRQKARLSYEKFQKASALIAALGKQ